MAQGKGSFPKSLIWVADQLREYEWEENTFGGKYAKQMFEFGVVIKMKVRNINLRMISRDYS